MGEFSRPFLTAVRGDLLISIPRLIVALILNTKSKE
jgi:hypothetical protein